jgi:hypothetical protein
MLRVKQPSMVVSAEYALPDTSLFVSSERDCVDKRNLYISDDFRDRVVFGCRCEPNEEFEPDTVERVEHFAKRQADGPSIRAKRSRLCGASSSSN